MSELDAFEEWFYEAIRGMHPTPEGADYVSLRSLAEDAWLAYRRHRTAAFRASGAGTTLILPAPEELV